MRQLMLHILVLGCEIATDACAAVDESVGFDGNMNCYLL